ncbi:hypothetical protein MN608_10953 [Microdochium nivale]|nr:hypothetical protein MN608_10953 [Microdochium nivale]
MPAMFGSEETKARSETPTSTRHLPNSDDDDDGDDDEPEFGDESCSEDSDHPSEPFTPEPKVTLRTRKIHVRLPTDPKQRLSPVIESDARRGAAGAGARQTPPEKRPSHGASARRDPVVVPIDSPEPPPAPAFDYSVPEPRPSFVTKELAQLSRDLDELSTSLGIEKPHSANPVHQPGADSSRDLDHTTARPPSRPSGAPKHVAHPASSSTRMFNFD